MGVGVMGVAKLGGLTARGSSGCMQEARRMFDRVWDTLRVLFREFLL